MSQAFGFWKSTRKIRRQMSWGWDSPSLEEETGPVRIPHGGGECLTLWLLPRTCALGWAKTEKLLNISIEIQELMNRRYVFICLKWNFSGSVNCMTVVKGFVSTSLRCNNSTKKGDCAPPACNFLDIDTLHMCHMLQTRIRKPSSYYLIQKQFIKR